MVKPGGNRPLQPVVNKFFYWLRASRLETDRISYWWANRMLTSERPLEEKMALFWHGHFATNEEKVRDYRKMLKQLLSREVNDGFVSAISQREGRGETIEFKFVGIDRAEITGQVALLVERCTGLLRPLETSCPREAAYLARQLGYTSGFYQVTDFWGSR